MNLKRLLLTLLLSLILVACGGESIAPAADNDKPEPAIAAETEGVEEEGAAASEREGVEEEGAVATEELNLPADVDVHMVATIKDRDDVFVFDVREQWEYDEWRIPAITLIPMGEVPNRLNEIPKDKTVIVTCNRGNRSGKITNFLRENGYTDVHNMLGGIQEWNRAGYEVER